MTANASPRRANPKRDFLPVFDYRKRKVRGICTRNGLYYGQFNGGKRYHLQGATNLQEAITARQVLKDKILKGEWPPKPTGTPNENVAPGVAPTTDYSLAAAIAGYREERDKLAANDAKTSAREDSGLNFWKQFAGTKGVNKMDTAMLRQYGVWRRGLKEGALKTAGIDTSKLTPEELLA